MAFTVDYHELDSTEATNGFISISGTPILSDNVAMDLIGGTAQSINNDFAVDGTTIRWDSTLYSLYGILSDGDQIRVIFDKSSI